MIEVGKKVVCIDDKPNDPGDFMFGLKEGDIYKVDDCHSCDCGLIELSIGIRVPFDCYRHCPRCKKTYGEVRAGDAAYFESDRFRLIDYEFADKVIEEVFDHELEIQHD